MNQKKENGFYLTGPIKRMDIKLFFKKISLCLYAFVAIAFFASCSKKSVDIPSTVLDKEEMVHVLADMHLVQAMAGINERSDSLRNDPNGYASSIFKMHHLTAEKYKVSLEFYAEHPELLEEIYGEVINELSKKQSEAERK